MISAARAIRPSLRGALPMFGPIDCPRPILSDPAVDPTVNMRALNGPSFVVDCTRHLTQGR